MGKWEKGCMGEGGIRFMKWEMQLKCMWDPSGVFMKKIPHGSHKTPTDKTIWGPYGIPMWAPLHTPDGPQMGPTCLCWLGMRPFVNPSDAKNVDP